MNQRRWLLLAILILAAWLRLVNLGGLPLGLNQDEAIAGYDAWSLWHTARDHHGALLPLNFRAYDDYIPPVHNYLLVPFVAALGLDVGAIRLASALAGTATVLATYGLGRALYGPGVGLLAAVFLAASPWHITYSRVALPGIMLPLFATLGLWAVAGALGGASAAAPAGTQEVGDRHAVPASRPARQALRLVAGGVLFAVALATYPVAKVFVPLLLAGVVVAWGGVFRRRPWLLAALLITFAIAALPFVIANVIQRQEVLRRYSAISVLNDPAPALRFAQSYLAHVSPVALFWDGYRGALGALPRGARQLLLAQAPLIAAGLVVLVRGAQAHTSPASTPPHPSRLGGSSCLAPRDSGALPGAVGADPRSRSWLCLWWLGAYPVASSLTTLDIPHEIRGIALLPLSELIAALGLAWVLGCLARRRPRLLPVAVYATASVVAVNVGWFGWHYFVAVPAEGAQHESFRPGLGSAIAELQAAAAHGWEAWAPPGKHMNVYVLFYTRYDPRAAQAGGLGDDYHFGLLPDERARAAASGGPGEEGRGPRRPLAYLAAPWVRPSPGLTPFHIVRGVGDRPLWFVYTSATSVHDAAPVSWRVPAGPRPAQVLLLPPTLDPAEVAILAFWTGTLLALCARASADARPRAF